MTFREAIQKMAMDELLLIDPAYRWAYIQREDNVGCCGPRWFCEGGQLFIDRFRVGVKPQPIDMPEFADRHDDWVLQRRNPMTREWETMR